MGWGGGGGGGGVGGGGCVDSLIFSLKYIYFLKMKSNRVHLYIVTFSATFSVYFSLLVSYIIKC